MIESDIISRVSKASYNIVSSKLNSIFFIIALKNYLNNSKKGESVFIF
jgi:hypothetical protein